MQVNFNFNFGCLQMRKATLQYVTTNVPYVANPMEGDYSKNFYNSIYKYLQRTLNSSTLLQCFKRVLRILDSSREILDLFEFLNHLSQRDSEAFLLFFCNELERLSSLLRVGTKVGQPNLIQLCDRVVLQAFTVYFCVYY